MTDHDSDAERARRAEQFDRLQRERNGETISSEQNSGKSKNRARSSAKSHTAGERPQKRAYPSSGSPERRYADESKGKKADRTSAKSDSGNYTKNKSYEEKAEESRSHYSRHYYDDEQNGENYASADSGKTERRKKREKKPIPEQHFENYTPKQKNTNNFFGKFHVRTNIDILVSYKVVLCLVGVLVLLVLAGFVYNAIANAVSKSNIPETEAALLTKINVNIEADAYFIRKETVIDMSASATVVPTVSNGSKVGIGDTVANVYASEEAAKTAAQLSDLKDKLSYYESIASVSSGKNLSSYNVYNANVNDSLLSMQKLIQSGDVSSLSEYGYEFSENLTKRQIAMGQSVDVTEAISTVNAEITSAKAAAAVSSTVTAPSAGCFMNFTDGYETVGDYANVKNFTESDVEALLNATPTTADTNKVGKLVHEFVWYAVCNLSKADAENLTVGGKTTVTVDGYSGDSLSLTVEAKNENDDGSVTVVFSSDNLNSETAQLRKEHIKILKASYTGYKVNIKALRTIDGQVGVNVLIGRMIDFRKVNVVYSGEEYAIVTGSSSESGYIELYDNVIIKGIDYVDGEYIK